MLLCLLSHLQGSEESTVTVHDNEPESVVVSEECSEGFRVELVITEVQRGVDRLERLKVNVHFLLFSLLSDDGAAVNDLIKDISFILCIVFIPLLTHQTVGRHFAVELESVLDRGDGPEHREPVHSGLDVGCCPVLISQHLGHTGNLIT